MCHRGVDGQLTVGVCSSERAVAHCSIEGGQCYRGILEATVRFMVRWHEEAKKSGRRHASGMSDVQENGGGGRATVWKLY